MNKLILKIKRKFESKTKAAEKIKNIRIACKITDECFSHILRFSKIGQTEIQIADEIKRFLLAKGAEDLSFPTIAVSGKRGSLIHGIPSSKKIQKGDFLTLDFGCKINGYCSDMTRTIAFNTISDKQKELYFIVLNAQEAATKKIKVNQSCFELDKIARDMIKKYGYGENYIHGTGHGITKEIHAAPTINQKSKEFLKTGDIITIEPGIYIENEFGLRIEDSILVTEAGFEILTKSSKKLIML
ncbi:MAG: aminopeptidase P family protein [Clostridiales Family XIII bacterium]|jgi:Xaa-Pro aminopeptidase|nr:aminopeptidase P family protein [Clostridiales Family XIII bacterium]